MAKKIPDGSVIAYCVRCQRKRKMLSAKRVVMKNGRPAVKGECRKCGSGMFRIGEVPT